MQIALVWAQQIRAQDGGRGKVVCQKMGERAGGTAGVRGGDVRGRPGSKARRGQAKPEPYLKWPLSPGSRSSTCPFYFTSSVELL